MKIGLEEKEKKEASEQANFIKEESSLLLLNWSPAQSIKLCRDHSITERNSFH